MRSSVSTQRYVYNAMACDEKIFVKKKKYISLKWLFGESPFKIIVLMCLYSQKHSKIQQKIKDDMREGEIWSLRKDK